MIGPQYLSVLAPNKAFLTRIIAGYLPHNFTGIFRLLALAKNQKNKRLAVTCVFHIETFFEDFILRIFLRPWY